MVLINGFGLKMSYLAVILQVLLISYMSHVSFALEMGSRMGLFLPNFDVLMCLVLTNGFVLKMSYLAIILLVLLISYMSHVSFALEMG